MQGRRQGADGAVHAEGAHEAARAPRCWSAPIVLVVLLARTLAYALVAEPARAHFEHAGRRPATPGRDARRASRSPRSRRSARALARARSASASAACSSAARSRPRRGCARRACSRAAAPLRRACAVASRCSSRRSTGARASAGTGSTASSARCTATRCRSSPRSRSSPRRCAAALEHVLAWMRRTIARLRPPASALAPRPALAAARRPSTSLARSRARRPPARPRPSARLSVTATRRNHEPRRPMHEASPRGTAGARPPARRRRGARRRLSASAHAEVSPPVVLSNDLPGVHARRPDREGGRDDDGDRADAAGGLRDRLVRALARLEARRPADRLGRERRDPRR